MVLLSDQPGMEILLALDDLLRQHRPGSRNLPSWVPLRDVVQLIFGQETS